MKTTASRYLCLMSHRRTIGVALAATACLFTPFSVAARADAEPAVLAPELMNHGDATCVVRNLRGAEYVGRAWGEYAMDRACHYAFDQCFRNSILPRTCHIVYRGPANFTGESASAVVPACIPEEESSCSPSEPDAL